MKEEKMGSPSATASGGAPRLSMRVQLVCCTDTLLLEIQLRETTRKDLAVTYAMALVSDEKTDWPAVNKAILGRWSFSGLNFIKRHAWKLVDVWKARSAPEAGLPAGGLP